MTGILLPAVLVTAGSLAALLFAHVLAARPEAEPLPVPDEHDPLTDTTPVASAVERTTPPLATGWHGQTVNSLSQVEDLLDSLEAHGVTDREVVALSDSSFLVRWR